MAAPAKPRSRARARGPIVTETPPASPQEVALLFAALELELSEIVREALASGQADTVRGRRLYERRARSLIAKMRPDARERVLSMLETAYGDGARLVGGRPPGAIQRAAMDELARATMQRLDGSLDTVGRQVDDIFRKVGLDQAARQIARELPGEAAADLMRRDLMKHGVTGFVDKRGRRWRLQTYSDMALRTVASEAQNRGVAEAMKAVGRDLVRVSDHHCNHHPNDPGSPCRLYEGGVFSLFGRTEGVPVLLSLPPWHPRCEHTVAPEPEPN